MKTVLKLSVVLLLLVVLIVPIAPGAHAAPLAGICVSNGVGGGNWSASGSWLCSGTGGAIFPNSLTIDVFVLSGDTITVDAASFAGNVTVEGTLNGGVATTLQIGGNFTNNGTFTANIGTITFSGSSAQSIGGASTFTFNNLTISNATGVNLNKDVTVNSTLALANGDLNTGANVLTLASGATVTAAGGGDVVGNVKRNGAFGVGSYPFNNPNTLINFSAVTTSPTDITINLVKTAPGGLANAVPRTYQITAGGAPSFTATVQFHYKTTEGGFTTEANLRPWKQVGGRWTLQPGSDTASGNNSFVSAAGVTSFSPWALADSGAPTAVMLSTFAANDPAQSNFVMPMLGLLGVVIAGGAWFARRARRN
ncbi:hypothetical protein ANRL1_04748 [Anaerolineae bacterium]|nr:hypothetical protein ANRL1_04748 [Anaerolineae bacterium]